MCSQPCALCAVLLCSALRSRAHLSGDFVGAWVSSTHRPSVGAPLPSQRGPGACALCAMPYYYYYLRLRDETFFRQAGLHSKARGVGERLAMAGGMDGSESQIGHRSLIEMRG